MSEQQQKSESPQVPPPASAEEPGPDEPVIEDVLPSFAMHTYMLNRSILEEESTCPPGYEETLESAPSTPSATPEYDPAVSILNNLSQLQKIELPLEITVYLTKKQPVFGKPYKRENPLREYKPGEVVTGVVSVENRSKEPLPFEMFLLSMEGCVGVPKSSQLGVDGPEFKLFLKTYDLSACYHPGEGPALNHMHGYFSQEGGPVFDAIDGAMYGLPGDRILQPGVTYKKFFTFILPKYLLDNTCPHQITPHLKVPPSFGVDTWWQQGRAGSIETSTIHGYGRCEDLGGPIRAIDFACDHQYIAYVINAQMIGRRLDCYKKYYKPTTSHNFDFIFIKDYYSFFRVNTAGIFDVNNMGSTESQLETFDKQLESFAQDILYALRPGADEEERKSDDHKVKCQLLDRDYSGSAVSRNSASSKHYNASGVTKLTKGLFSKTIGSLHFTAYAPVGMSLSAIRPRCFADQTLSAGSSCSSVTGSVSSTLAESFSSTASSISLDASDPITLELQFFPEENNRAPPTEITAHLSLRMVDVSDPYQLPVSLDDNFIMKYGDKLGEFRAKYVSAYREVYDLSRETETRVPKALYEGLVALNKIDSRTHDLKGFFKKVTAAPKWTFDKAGHVYTATVELPLKVAAFVTANKLYIPPNFETCWLGRWYQVGIDIGKETIRVPVRVV